MLNFIFLKMQKVYLYVNYSLVLNFNNMEFLKHFCTSMILVFILIRDLTQKQSPQVFYKKRVLKHFAKFTGNHLCRGFFLMKLQATGLRPSTLLKKDSDTGISL